MTQQVYQDFNQPLVTQPIINPHLHPVQYVADRKLVCQESSSEIWMKSQSKPDSTDPNVEVAQNYSYVQFSRPSPHDYSYPNITTVGSNQMRTNQVRHGPRRDSLSSMKRHNLEVQQPALPTKNKKKQHHKDTRYKNKDKKQNRLLQTQRVRCIYCRDTFTEETNYKGSCPDAPDCLANCIERVSCTCCATGMLYHCMSDSDGDFGNVCVCDTSDSVGNCRKWTALGVLSLLVPCLCCYWPLSSCHRCAVSCGCCGGQHKAAWQAGDVAVIGDDNTCSTVLEDSIEIHWKSQ